ncbi:MAG: restriction endonuclease [Nitrosopumilaceae archaeon]
MPIIDFDISKKKTFIKKASGKRVLFNENKILSTCRRAGANKKTAQQILKKVRGQIYQGISTKNIYQLVLRAISEEKAGRGLRQRYQLKEAIMKLGPNGFAFENYVGKLLEHYGLQIQGIRSKVKGECSTHEIDLIASSGEKKYMVECKHHSTRGGFIGLKVALYTHARFLDTSPKFDGEAIVCNAKVSQNAKKYAKCIDQQIFSWRYPPNKSLEKIIEDYKLYPITILNLNSKELDKFSAHNLMIAKDLLKQKPSALSKITGISERRIYNLSKLARQIIVKE